VPTVLRRAGWGANEQQMNWRPQYAPYVKAVALHHTATGNEYTPEDVPKILRSIYQYQTVSRGWGDIGYNVLVDRFGRLWEGHSGGLSRPVVGAQAGGFNTGTAGIAMTGDYRSVNVPQVVQEAAAQYTAWKLSLHQAIDPRGRAARRPQGAARVHGGRAGPVRRPADYDGNGTIDAATWSPATQQFTVDGRPAIRFGGAAGRPVSAQYDGDGRADPAVFHDGRFDIRGRAATTSALPVTSRCRCVDVGPVDTPLSRRGHRSPGVRA
jgi:hypothetical protein